MRTLIYSLFLLPALSLAQGNVENPEINSTESGIGVISGWHCTAKTISVKIDGINLGNAGAGTQRGDTASVCEKTETGFSLLVNFSAFTPGKHTLETYADGQLIDTRTFTTVRSGGQEFLTGMIKTAYVSDFPVKGSSIKLEWSQSKQSFVVTSTGTPLIDNACSIVQKMAGTWNFNTNGSQYKYTFNLSRMSRDDKDQVFPCYIGGTSSSLISDGVGALYSTTAKKIYAIEQSGGISKVYTLSPVSEIHLEGSYQQMFTSSSTLFGSTYAATADKIAMPLGLSNISSTPELNTIKMMGLSMESALQSRR